MDDEGVISPARVRQDTSGQRFTVLVANAKGGCGKTTLATNLASLYAHRGSPVSLLDLDPQQSADTWLNLRRQSGLSGIESLRLPLSGELRRAELAEKLRGAGPRIIIDSPAGLDARALEPLLEVSQVVLVPVLPSPLDIRAATRFLQTLMLTRSFQRHPRRLAVVANRTRQRTVMFSQLKRFLQSLKIPYLTSLRDTQLLAHAAGEGKGLFELDQDRARGHLDDWQPIVEWLEVQRQLIRASQGSDYHLQ